MTNNFWFPELNYNIPYSTEPDSKFVKFWKNEVHKFQNGFWIADGQVHIGGWVYWHTVYWNIELDVEMGNGESFKAEGIPYFRDLEWEVQEDCLKPAVKQKKGFSWIGSRGPGKSYILASIAGMYYSIYHDTQIVVAASNTKYLDLCTAKIDYGLTRLPKESLYKHRILDDWSTDVLAGYKSEGTRVGSNSRFAMRNYQEGNNPTAASGTRPKIHIIDEQGECLGLIKCYNAGKQCWYNDFGQFCIPILGGTGGNMNKGKDSVLMFLNPAAYNLLEFPDTTENRKNPIGFFTPVTKARNEFKDKWTLYRYLTEVRKMDLKPHPDLERITIMVSDEERCLNEFVLPRRAAARLAHDNTSLTSEIAFYPLTPTEAFSVIGNTQFPVQLCKEQYDFLEENDITGQSIELYRDNAGTVHRRFSDAKPITDYPVKPSDDNTGAIMMLEDFIKDSPDGLYIAGADPYAHDDTDNSVSLGAIYIYKRLYSIDQTYVDELVAWYVGRPETRKQWHQNAEMLMDYYNAVCMPENETQTFIQYFEEKNKLYMLADGLQLLKEVSPNSDVKRNKGLPPTPAIQKYYMDLIKDYMVEDIVVGTDPVTQEPIVRKGVIRIKDKMLLREAIEYQEGNNCDRLVAFGHVLAYNRSLLKYGVVEESESNSSVKSNVRTSGYFSKGSNYFSGKRKSLI